MHELALAAREGIPWTLMLVGARAQGVSDAKSDRRLLTRMLLPALTMGAA